jgi:hypothetical protein
VSGGVSIYLCDLMLRSAFSGASLSRSGGYLSLHYGPPSDDGQRYLVTGTRVSVTFATSVYQGVGYSYYLSNTNTVSWSSVTFTSGIPLSGVSTDPVDVTHWSLWDASTGGNCLATGPLGGTWAVAASPSTSTSSTFYANGHTFAVNDLIEIDALPTNNVVTPSLPGGMYSDTIYYVKTVSGSTFTLSTNSALSDTVTTTSAGTFYASEITKRTIYAGDTITFIPGTIVITLS